MHPAVLLAASSRLAATGVQHLGLYITLAVVLVVIGVGLMVLTRKKPPVDDEDD